tara:strand:+ start:5002 stop:5736 length:735 start_codon:yes stop_codon:yes gene_type:complete
MNDENFHGKNWRLHDFVKIHQDDPTKLYPSQEDIVCELQLATLGDWFPLDFKINQEQWHEDKALLRASDYYRPFQPKEGIMNDRESVLVYGLEGDTPTATTGLTHFEQKHGYRPKESDFNVPTEARHKIKSLHPFFDWFEPFGRTFIITLNQGGFFGKHRDHWWLSRDTIRLIGFLGKETHTGHLQWEVDGQIMDYMTNHIYYVNTAKIHRLCAWKHDCDMVVCNVPKTWTNILKLFNVLHNAH